MGVILPLTRVPDGKIAEKALEVLINLGKQQSLREKVASLGGLQCLIDICQSYISGADHAMDEQVLEKCLLTLNNLLYGNAANKKMFTDLKGIPALLQLESSLDDGSVKTKLMQVLRTFTGSANLRQQSGDRRVGRARERIKRNTDEKDQTALLDICLASPSSLGEERGRSSSRSGRSCSRERPIRRGRGSDSDLERKPALGSLSRNRLLQESSSDDEIYDSAARTYSSGEEAGGLPVIALPDPSKPVNTATLYELSEKNYYILGQKVSFKQDDLHELRSTRDVKKVMFKTVEKLICGFMNQGKGGHIYFGIDTNSLVQGIRISRDERDRLRVGLDDIMKRFTPVVSHAMFEVLYSQVVQSDGHDNPQTRKPVKDFCVIELRLSKAGDIFLTSDERCFLRVEGKTKSLYTQEIRELIVSREERKFKAEMERLLELGRTLRMHLGFSEASGGQCP
ncbi:uncharacterized protein LOC106175297 [Lingula anatina]|uniref:Uncharacterized protein LOC106175297 n=1 Tax=Lingula anatina TaxID=7574 RepID=A0A1S3JQM8_LINAN|nr:uncharacterized protein LOC106175297 [Lingula anatina]|eukprot:XP_013412693.1 uncharacterized protein LOC106175297 [Lingula anatina]